MRRTALVVLTATGGLLLLQTPALAGKRQPADTTRPSVAISSPSAGSSVSSSVTVRGTASDDRSLLKVELQVDAGSWATASGTSSWSRTVTLPTGSHTLTARATDGSGNTSSTSQTVTVAAADTAGPTLTISSPAEGASVGGTVQVTGAASDSGSVAEVAVSLDGGAFTTASGTTSWSATLTAAAGSHSVTARATDSSGNATTATRSFTVSASSTSSGTVLDDPSASNGLALLGRGRAAAWGSTSALVYWEESTSHRGVALRTGTTTTYVALPADSSSGWSNLAYTMTSAGDLWILGGNGPLNLRHYAISGGAATMVSDEVLGDGDSRMGDLVRLASGALVLTWHQQGSTGPQGQYVSYRKGSVTSTLGPLTFMPTKASKQVLVQHPGDGSVWLFSDPDAWGAIGAVHLTEGATGLSTDWTDSTYLSTSAYGELGPDPENPDLEAEPDPATGTVVLAYQGNHRQIFQTTPTVVTGAYPVIGRVTASGSWTLTQLPVYVERISSLGLTVAGGDVRLLYRPIDTATMTFDHLRTAVLHAGAWQPSTEVGQLWTAYERVSSSPGADLAAVRLSDGLVHLLP